MVVVTQNKTSKIGTLSISTLSVNAYNWIASIFLVIYNIAYSYMNYVKSLVVPKKKKNFDTLDNMTKAELVTYLQNTKFPSYEISSSSVKGLETMKLQTDKIQTNLIEIVEKLGEEFPKDKSLGSTSNEKYSKRIYCAPYELIKDHQEENAVINKFKVRYDIEKAKFKLNVSDIDKDEYINSFGEEKYNKDMMGISKKLLQILPSYYHDRIVSFYNKNLEQGCDESYSFGKITFMWKGKGDKKDLKSYRKITSLPNITNHFHRILALRLSEYFERNNYFDKTIQKAGISGINYGIFEQVFKLRSVIKDANENNKPSAILFLDLKSAFDNIDRDAVFKMMDSYNVDQKYSTYLKSFYDSLHYYASSKNKHTDLKKWGKGLLQGCSLSPLLFTMSMNYILTYLNKTSLNANGYQFTETESKLLFLAFMDDICVTCNSMESLKEIYEELVEYFESFGLSINTQKSAVMLINIDNKYSGILHDIPIVESQTYLGNVITADGTYDKNYDAVKKNIYAKLAQIKHSNSTHEEKEERFKGIYPTIKRILLKMYDVDGDDMNKMVWMINQNLEEMKIDTAQFDFDIKNTRDYAVTISQDSVMSKIPAKLNKVKNDNVKKPSKMDMQELREAYENTKESSKNESRATNSTNSTDNNPLLSDDEEEDVEKENAEEFDKVNKVNDLLSDDEDY